MFHFLETDINRKKKIHIREQKKYEMRTDIGG